MAPHRPRVLVKFSISLCRHYLNYQCIFLLIFSDFSIYHLDIVTRNQIVLHANSKCKSAQTESMINNICNISII